MIVRGIVLPVASEHVVDGSGVRSASEGGPLSKPRNLSMPGTPLHIPFRRPRIVDPDEITIIGVQQAFPQPLTLMKGQSVSIDLRFTLGQGTTAPTYLIGDDGARYEVRDDGRLEELTPGSGPGPAELYKQRLEREAHDMAILRDSLESTGDKLQGL